MHSVEINHLTPAVARQIADGVAGISIRRREPFAHPQRRSSRPTISKEQTLLKGSIKQRSPGSWQIRVFLGRDPQGKIMRRNETVRGKKADAERRLREILTELDHGITPPKKPYKLAEWLNKWMKDVIIPNRRQKTVDRYQGDIRKHIVPHLGHIDIAKLSPSHIQDLESQLLRNGKKPKGVQMIHNILSGAMKHALRMELVSRNPVTAVTSPSAPKVEAFSPEIAQVKELLSTAASLDHYFWACIHLIIYTGMRRGEALALMWENLDLDEQTLQIKTSLVITSLGLALEPPKTARGLRTVDLDDLTVAVLRQHRSRQLELARHLDVDPPDMVFPRQNLQEWCHPNTLSHAVQSLAKKSGCPQITLRSLRHFHATVLLQQNKDNPVVASQRLGHSKTSITTDIYGHVLDGWQREIADSFAQTMDDQTMDDQVPDDQTVDPEP